MLAFQEGLHSMELVNVFLLFGSLSKSWAHNCYCESWGAYEIKQYY